MKPRFSEPAERTRTTLPADLTKSIGTILNSGLPHSPAVTRQSIDAVLGSSRETAGHLTPRSAVAYISALAWSLLRSGRAGDALHLADRRGLALLRLAAGEASAPSQSACYAVLSEVFLLNGRLTDAAACAASAVDYAETQEAARFRGLSLQAASQALNGEFTAAARTMGSAREVDAGRGWSGASWPLALAAFQIGFRRNDSEGMQQILDSLTVETSDVVARSVGLLGRILLSAVHEDFHQVIATAESLTRGTDRALAPPFLGDLGIQMSALAMVHLGDPGAALKLIEGRTSSPAHVICFELQSAGIFLRLDQPRKALELTETCVRDVPDHSLRTFPSVLLRRAVAHELLGHHALADADFSRATHLAVEVSGIRSAIGLPMDVLEVLYHRMLAREPGFRRPLTEKIPEAGIYPDPEPLGFQLAPLTERERVLANWLTTDLTLAAIADELCVSINTVKTQAKSLYRKLGVSTRDDAVQRLESIGTLGG